MIMGDDFCSPLLLNIGALASSLVVSQKLGAAEMSMAVLASILMLVTVRPLVVYHIAQLRRLDVAEHALE